MRGRFENAAAAVTHALGSPPALLAAVLVVVVWALSGPVFGFSDTWQLVINTGTTIVTFLMVFVIQNAQNRDSKALHAKLDELIRATGSARDELVDAEFEPEELLDRQIAELRAWAAEASPSLRTELARRLEDVPGVEEVTLDLAPSGVRDGAAPVGRSPDARAS
jgi:low affinity Fe/Cu permease